jgi:predicted  nucleic acid-binding Zn-ribbon protein
MKHPTLASQIEASQIELENLQTRRKDESDAIAALGAKVLEGDVEASRDAAARRGIVDAIDDKMPQLESHLAALSEQLEAERAAEAEAAAKASWAQALADIETDVEVMVKRFAAFASESQEVAAKISELQCRINSNVRATGGDRYGTRTSNEFFWKASSLTPGEARLFVALNGLSNEKFVKADRAQIEANRARFAEAQARYDAREAAKIEERRAEAAEKRAHSEKMAANFARDTMVKSPGAR